MEQIKILGAGISGLTAAINLAKAGYNVKVFEKNSDVGKSHKLDFEGLENWTSDIMKTLRDINIKTDFKNEAFSNATWYSPSFRKAEIESKQPFFYLVERGGNNSIEYSLKKQAIEKGVEFEFNSKKSPNVCNIISVGAKKPEGFAFGSFFEKINYEDNIIGILSNKFSPKGYFYVLVWDGRACVVTLAYKSKNTNLPAIHKNNLKMEIVQKIIKNSRKKHDFAGFANFGIPKTAVVNGKILTGETAGFQECFMGFGMKYAFLSGYFAAKSISENISYDELWKESFLKEMKKSYCNRFLINVFGDSVYEMIISYLQKNSNCKNKMKSIYCDYNLMYEILYKSSKITKT